MCKSCFNFQNNKSLSKELFLVCAINCMSKNALSMLTGCLAFFHHMLTISAITYMEAINMARAADKVVEKIEELTDTSSAQLQEQIAQLKEDIAAIAATITQLGQQKIRDAKRDATHAYEEALQNSGDSLNDLKSCAQSIEEQLVETIRERPIASLATAVGVGYLLALLRR
jgi:ElaB/YqjD/DUF883 family membrane-anchored ribosome-binding protein